MTGAPGFDDARSFKAIWHAQLFALTVHLYDRGVFTWPQWSAALGRQLEQQPPEARLAQDQSEDSYYLAWLAALMDCLAGKQLTDEAEVGQMYDRWAAAYLATPHGQPVKLSKPAS